MISARRPGFTTVALILIALALLAFAGTVAYYASQKGPSAPSPIPGPTPGPTPSPVACTMEAKLCPDGSYVGRSGPNCEFAPCPGNPAPGYGSDCATDSDCAKGYRCVQDCGPPVARENDPTPASHCISDAEAAKPRMCPICLASNTQISTPDGSVNIKALRAGMRVWSLSNDGTKVASIVKQVTRTPVPKTHRVVHLTLSDAREVWVSPNHPTTDARTVGQLKAGDAYDGATVRATDLMSYWDDATYDLLPDSETGRYWANGVLLGSTLRR